MSLLDGKVVVITGGGGGGGRSIAVGCAAAGGKVVVADTGVNIDGSAPKESVAAPVASEIRNAGGQAAASSGDVTSSADVRAMIALALDNWGRIDGAVCCAGILRHRP